MWAFWENTSVQRMGGCHSLSCLADGWDDFVLGRCGFYTESGCGVKFCSVCWCNECLQFIWKYFLLIVYSTQEQPIRNIKILFPTFLLEISISINSFYAFETFPFIYASTTTIHTFRIRKCIKYNVLICRSLF